jgi:hypothetical protein
VKWASTARGRAHTSATGRSDFTQSYPWLIAFGFGLLHGLGFAGALAEIGLPHGEIPLALFSFNVGVEVGQLAFKRRFRGRCKVHFWRNRDLSLGSRNVRFRGTVKSRSATEMGRTPEGPLSSDLPTSARGAHGLRRPHIAAYDVDGRQGTKPIGVNV